MPEYYHPHYHDYDPHVAAMDNRRGNRTHLPSPFRSSQMFDAKTLTTAVFPDINHNDLAMVANRVDHILSLADLDPIRAIEMLVPYATGRNDSYYMLWTERRRDAMALAVLGAAVIGERLAQISDGYDADSDEDIHIKNCIDCNGIHDMPGDRCPVCSQ